jgi:hypothetical protein
MNFSRALATIFALLILTACGDQRMNTDELANEVKKSMASSSEFKGSGISVKSLILTRLDSESNIYKGVLTTAEPNGEFTYTVDVTYDGNNMTWEISG